MQTIPAENGAVTRWARLKARYPEAGRWFDDGWWYGFLRHRDSVVRETSLGRLIDALLGRETAKARR
jgi:hypothetical protein